MFKIGYDQLTDTLQIFSTYNKNVISFSLWLSCAVIIAVPVYAFVALFVNISFCHYLYVSISFSFF